MDDLLEVCLKKEQRAVTRFLWSKGVSGADIHRKLLTQYSDSELPRTGAYKLIEKFKSGRISPTHEEVIRHSSTSTKWQKHSARLRDANGVSEAYHR